MYTILVDVFHCLIKYLCVTWCGSVPLDCSYVLLWIDTVVFYNLFYSDCLEDYQQYWKLLSARWMIQEQIFPRRKMVQNIYSSRTYVQIRRMALVSLCGVSDLSNIMSNYSDGVWFREMMQLMTLIVMIVLMI